MPGRHYHSGWLLDPSPYLKQAAIDVEKMFEGPKAGLKPFFETVVRFARSNGADVRVCPCQTIVPFYRNAKHAGLKPATKTRLERTLALGDTLLPKDEVEPPGKGERQTPAPVRDLRAEGLLGRGEEDAEEGVREG